MNFGINKTMYETLEEEINSHVDYVLHEPTLKNFVQPREWEEVEHTDLSLNPVFIAIYDINFKLVENSPNLIQNKLEWNKNQAEQTPFYANYNSIQMLLSQAKLVHHGEVVGYLVVGISTKHNQLALDYLQKALLLIFPISLIIIFLLARFIAAKSIKPVFNVIHTAQAISENNLSERIILPKNKDELYQLSTTINSLLDRLEFQIIKAKQFSSDASHELRTPLAVIKGTLEILIRRERTTEEYNEKINYTLKQVNRLYNLVEQFLLLSRVENNSLQLTSSDFDIKNEVLSSIDRFQILLDEKQIEVNTTELSSQSLSNYKEFIEIIIDNILSNSIKYVHLKGEITISSVTENNLYHLIFEDNGIGMSEDDLKFVQDRYFRIQDESMLNVSGYGLGLNIATKLAQLTNAKINITSTQGKGTKIVLTFILK
ncbi:Signal transduction histidine kinase [Algoriella xinjiangensis]|uniref:histidine kinase n=2 Tax=Algoriella xinjiangensis TaxID=684065 RepID=A0A1I4TRX8_9FLAO|nr:Signal transduction histidine kinase [Algoriella xinjiangensis]